MPTHSYQYEARNVVAFVAQVVRYVSSGYFFYVRCIIPEHRDVRRVDEKLLALYDVAQPRWRRERRNLKTSAGIHYIRYKRLFVIMLTKGRHEAFYNDHGAAVRDIRRNALKVFGYSIRHGYYSAKGREKTSVRLDDTSYANLKSHLMTVALWDSYRDNERLEREFSRLHYEPYGPVCKQLFSIARAVNRGRRKRGFTPIDCNCIRTKKRLVKVFVDRVKKDEK